MGYVSELRRLKFIMDNENIRFDNRFEALKLHTKIGFVFGHRLTICEFKTKTRLEYEKKIRRGKIKTK
jgi:hypothetical protein